MTERERAALRRPFGAESRDEMLSEWFSASPPPTAETAWEHVYRLLLWIDRTTGLAHCYESDKAQPGRPWYARSLAFHGWVAGSLDIAPGDLGGEVDWLFREGTKRLAEAAARVQVERTAAAAIQRQGYEHFPVPGDDPELETIIVDQLAPWLAADPPRETLAELTRVVRTYYAHENKRRNLVGEGFEDVLAAILSRIPGGDALNVRARVPLHELPGFREPPGREKARTVDLAVTTKSGRRLLASVKWSVRADREEQFAVDFDAYARLESEGRDFDFVLVTNEFDAARLYAASERRRLNAYLFTHVVHVNPDGPLSVYSGEGQRGAAKQLQPLVQEGRLVSLEAWLTSLTH